MGVRSLLLNQGQRQFALTREAAPIGEVRPVGSVPGGVSGLGHGGLPTKTETERRERTLPDKTRDQIQKRWSRGAEQADQGGGGPR